jgi:TetR/AcrR family transcriptional repressor of nem operon
MGRPRRFSEETVLQVAATVFVRGGYEGTSIDDLVQALKLHRGSLYNAFGSKHGLFLAVLRRYVQTQLPAAINSVSPPGDGHPGVGALADGDDLDLLLIAAVERGHLDAEVAALVRHALAGLEQALEAEANPGRSPNPASAPTRALDLLGERLYQHLHGSDTPGTQHHDLTKEN